MEERERVKKLGSRFSPVARPPADPWGSSTFILCVHCAAAACKSGERERGGGREGDENWQWMTLH